MSDKPAVILSADQILGVDDVEIITVDVKEWGGAVRLRTLPADEGLALSQKMAALTKEQMADAMFLLLAACIVDADGHRMFTSDEHLAKLRSRNTKVLLRLQAEAMHLQGWGEGSPAKNA